MYHPDLSMVKPLSERENAIRLDGRSTSLIIKNKEHISDGHCGRIYRAHNVEVVGSNGKKRTLRGALVIKEYTFVAREDIRDFLRMHEILRTAEVDTWNTFCLLESRNVAIMTDGEASGGFTVSGNNVSESSKRLLKEGTESLIGLRDTIMDATNSAERASRVGVKIHNDAWFANFSNQLHSDDSKCRKIKRVFVGDYDTLQKTEGDSEEVKEYNKAQLRKFFGDLLRRFVEGEEHYKKIQDEMEEIFDEQS